jgi:hypothetical protein
MVVVQPRPCPAYSTFFDPFEQDKLGIALARGGAAATVSRHRKVIRLTFFVSWSLCEISHMSHSGQKQNEFLILTF